MIIFGWPTKVWEMGDVDENDKQLWYSTIPTKEDRQRRIDYQIRYLERQEDQNYAKQI